MSALEPLNTALAGRYAGERKIGADGMAAVYLACDLKHQRHVALKALLPLRTLPCPCPRRPT